MRRDIWPYKCAGGVYITAPKRHGVALAVVFAVAALGARQGAVVAKYSAGTAYNNTRAFAVAAAAALSNSKTPTFGILYAGVAVGMALRANITAVAAMLLAAFAEVRAIIADGEAIYAVLHAIAAGITVFTEISAHGALIPADRAALPLCAKTGGTCYGRAPDAYAAIRAVVAHFTEVCAVGAGIAGIAKIRTFATGAGAATAGVGAVLTVIAAFADP